MRTGRPPKDPSEKSARARSKNPKAIDTQNVADTLQPPPARDGKGRSPVGSARTDSPFIGALKHCRTVTPSERRLIEDAGVKGFGLADASSFWLFQFLRVEKAHKSGELDAKSYAIALNQLLTASTKLAEIHARSNSGDTPGEIKFVFDISKTMQGRVAQPEPGPNGDMIEVG